MAICRIQDIRASGEMVAPPCEYQYTAAVCLSICTLPVVVNEKTRALRQRLHQHQPLSAGQSRRRGCSPIQNFNERLPTVDSSAAYLVIVLRRATIDSFMDFILSSFDLFVFRWLDGLLYPRE